MFQLKDAFDLLNKLVTPNPNKRDGGLVSVIIKEDGQMVTN